MPHAREKAMSMPDWPPMALPMATRRRVRQVRRKVILSRFISFTSAFNLHPVKEKDLYPMHG